MKVTTKRPAEKAAAAAMPATAKPRRLFPRVRMFCAALAILLILGGGWFAWRTVGDRVLDSPRFRVQTDGISITPPPDWIRTDIRGELSRAAGLDDRVSILDAGLAERIHKAFALHPWVAKVVRVHKRSPARLDVELEYRRPVCMVEVPGGLYPVDIEGVLLPSADFSPLEARAYPRLSGIQPTTEGPVGTPWQDPRVVGAARVAAALIEVWQELGLSRIVPVAGHSSREAFPEYEITTKGGTRIVWGHPPAGDAAGRALAEKKVARLRQYYTERGTFEGPDGPQEIDLREEEILARSPK